MKRFLKQSEISRYITKGDRSGIRFPKYYISFYIYFIKQIKNRNHENNNTINQFQLQSY